MEGRKERKEYEDNKKRYLRMEVREKKNRKTKQKWEIWKGVKREREPKGGIKRKKRGRLKQGLRKQIKVGLMRNE